MQMIKIVEQQEFGRMFPAPAHIFNTVAFVEHNRWKCDDGDVRYLLLGDTKVRGGIVLGRRDGVLHNPFSAPFGGLLTLRRQGFEAIEAMWGEIDNYARAEGLGLRVTLPPEIYDTDTTVKSINSLLRMGFAPTPDVNYHLDLRRGTLSDVASPTCNNKLRQALKSGAVVSTLDLTPRNIARVYHIISTNHLSKGRPMWMSLDDVVATAQLVGAQLFIVTHDGVDVAGSLIYPIAPDTMQVVFWGDLPGYGDLRPMNLLADFVYTHYHTLGISTLDLGPATESGTPNYGLCSFKESLGATPSLKYTFRR